MTAMRLAATLAHAVPGVRLRLWVGDEPHLEVARPPHDAGAVPACAFRDRVVAAHRTGSAAVAVDCVPTIEVGVPAGGAVHPSGVIRVGLDRAELHAFATTLSPEACARVFGPRGGDRVVHLYRDVGTDVTVVHVEAPPRDRRSVLAFLEDLLAASLTEELIGSP